MRKWYSILAAAANGEAEIRIDGIIGWGVDARGFVNELKALKAPVVNVHINSEGGDVFEGTAIYNALKSYDGKVVAHIDGIALSMGSVIAMAADEIRINENAYMMIHNPWGMAIGEGDDMRQTADVMDQLKDALASTYAARSGMNLKQVAKLMDEETWYVGGDAKAVGLADVVVPNKGKASGGKVLNVGQFKHVPEGLADTSIFAGMRRMVCQRAIRQRPAAAIDPERIEDLQNFIMASTEQPAGGGASQLPAGHSNAVTPQENTVITLAQFEEFAAANPDALKKAAKGLIDEAATKAAADARAAEIARAKSLNEIKGVDAPFAIEQFVAGADVTGAKAALHDRAVKQQEQDAANPHARAGRPPVGGSASNEGSVNALLADVERRNKTAAGRR